MSQLFVAASVDHEETLMYLMQAFCDLARFNYEHMLEFIVQI